MILTILLYVLVRNKHEIFKFVATVNPPAILSPLTSLARPFAACVRTYWSPCFVQRLKLTLSELTDRWRSNAKRLVGDSDVFWKKNRRYKKNTLDFHSLGIPISILPVHFVYQYSNNSRRMLLRCAISITTGHFIIKLSCRPPALPPALWLVDADWWRALQFWAAMIWNWTVTLKSKAIEVIWETKM